MSADCCLPSRLDYAEEEILEGVGTVEQRANLLLG